MNNTVQNNMARKAYPLADFGINAPVSITGFEAGHAHQVFVPATKNTGYVFQKDLFRKLHAWLDDPRGEGFFLSGPTGSGKTSFMIEMAARLNWPVIRVMGPKIREFSELEGQLKLKGDGLGGTLMEYVFGPLAEAMRHGFIFILDEMDQIPEHVSMALNEILEGNAMTIFGDKLEVIDPHPNFRLFATGNTLGQGDDTGLYAGAIQQNLAFMDRFWVAELGYPEEAVEEAILTNACPKVPKEIRQKMVRVANTIRNQFVGTGNEGATLTVTLSTRTLVRWGDLAARFKGQKSPMKYSFDVAFACRAPLAQRAAINEVARAIFGDDAWEG